MDRLDFTDHSMEEDNKSGNSLELTFSIGYNTKMIGAVHNLTIDKKKVNHFSKY